MKTFSVRLLFRLSGVAALVAAGACGGSDSQSVLPTVSIASPIAGSTVTVDAMQSSPVVFATENFSLKPPGTAGCGVGCGNVHLFIDGDACTPAGSAANNAGAVSPLAAQFGACATPIGSHKITLGLYNNDDTPLLDASGAKITASVSVTTKTPNSGVPSVVLTMPANHSTVTLGTDVNKSVPISFTTENFTLAAVGTPSCGTGCGHVHVLIDNAACNASGQTFNAEGSASPISALFAFCPVATGMHTVSAELHNNDHTPVSGASASSFMIETQ